MSERGEPGREKGPGDVILKKYIIIKYLGGMESVYLVQERIGKKRKYIAKHVKPENENIQEFETWFERQYNNWMQIARHRYIVRPVAIRKDPSENITYFFTEYIPGRNVYEIVTDGASQGRISYPQMLRWAQQIAEALEYTTNAKLNGMGAFVHRDLGASNVLISHTGEVKIIDWGISKDLDAVEEIEDGHTVSQFTKKLLGRSNCMPPEFFPPGKGKDYGVPGDVYFFGTLLYFMLTGEYANPVAKSEELNQNATSEKQVCYELSKYHQETAFPKLRSVCPDSEFVNFLEDCINVDRARRIQDFTEVMKRLEQLQCQFEQKARKANYYVCSKCHFVTEKAQTTCPVCDQQDVFSLWSETTIPQVDVIPPAPPTAP
ncbi:MAG: protein kinase, partial [bacterium]